MPTFSEHQLMNDLRIVLLEKAHHLRLIFGKDHDFPAKFLGFEPKDWKKVDPEDILKVNLSNFTIGDMRLRMYEYAWSGDGSITKAEIMKARTFNRMSPNISDNSTLYRTAECAWARWRLFNPDQFGPDNYFSVYDLANLADMTEGAVRGAFSNKDITPVEHFKPVSADWNESWRWLNGRRGFVKQG